MELKEPKRKRFAGKTHQSQSLPVLIESISGITASSSLWPVYVGTFSGDSVIVSVRDEMSSLYNMGFFGKGSLSRGYPTFGEAKKGIPPFIRGRQWKRRKLWMDQLLSFNDPTCYGNLKDSENCIDKTYDKDSDSGKQNYHKEPSDFEEIEIIDSEQDVTKNNKNVKNYIDSEKQSDTNNLTIREQASALDVETNSEKRIFSIIDNSTTVTSGVMVGSNNEQDSTSHLSEQNMNSQSNTVVVIDDSGSEDESLLHSPHPRICDEPIKTAVETLNLTLEEAFFLSFGLGCLQVVDLQGIFLSLRGMWHLYKDSQHDFISSYVTYHYFRSKGWIVKPGAKFGGNFLLYKKGPPFYHASYVVIIEEVKNKHDVSYRKRELTWTKIMGLNRIAETAGKEILISQVLWPTEINSEELNNPLIISKFKVQEVLMRRWNSSHEREEKEEK